MGDAGPPRLASSCAAAPVARGVSQPLCRVFGKADLALDGTVLVQSRPWRAALNALPYSVASTEAALIAYLQSLSNGIASSLVIDDRGLLLSLRSDRHHESAMPTLSEGGSVDCPSDEGSARRSRNQAAAWCCAFACPHSVGGFPLSRRALKSTSS